MKKNIEELYVNVGELVEMLKEFDTSKPVYFGNDFMWDNSKFFIEHVERLNTPKSGILLNDFTAYLKRVNQVQETEDKIILSDIYAKKYKVVA